MSTLMFFIGIAVGYYFRGKIQTVINLLKPEKGDKDE